MAKSRPALGGLFRLKGKHETSVKLTSLSTYGHADKKNFNNKALGENQFTSFTQFGNYRPKILSDSESKHPLGVTETSGKSVIPEPAQPSTSGETLPKTPRYSSSDDPGGQKSTYSSQISPTQSSNKPASANVKKGLKTKSSKNFIIMGDKHTPLVFEKSENGSQDGDELPEELPQGRGQVERASSLMEQVLTFGEDDLPDEASPSINDETEDDVFQSEVPDKIPEQKQHLQPIVNVINGHVPRDESNKLVIGTKKEMPYIPPPDYDEEVMTIDISDEDDTPGNPPPSEDALSSRRVYRVYQGDDFGQYLKEEDSMFTSPTSRTKTRYKKSTSRSNQKKDKAPSKPKNKSIKGTLTKALFGSSQKNSLEENAKRHTIHEFSFGHSKIGLGDSAGIPKGVWNTGSSHKHNGVPQHSTQHRQGNYELFLSSREGDHMKSGSLESTSDSGNESGEDNNNMHPQRQYHMTNPVYSSPNKYVKKNGLWEKLTLRFRRRSRGEIGTVN